tara:strand:- start:1600 stop:2019 length:420 start_codon:yes stop_codon:yes gene_type:complete
MKKLLYILLAFVLFIIYGISQEKSQKTEKEKVEINKDTLKKQQVTFNQVGYFKSDDKYRCFAFTYDVDDKNQILSHAKAQMNSSGRTTQVYYFNELAAGIGDKITLSNSFFDATELCLDLDWKYEYTIYPSGKENFRKK